VQEEENLIVFNKQLGEDRRIVMSRSNLNELLKVHRHRLNSVREMESICDVIITIVTL